MNVQNPLSYLTAGKKSRQVVSTPPALLAYVQQRWGAIVLDLAADNTNAVCSDFFDEKQDSLAQDWAETVDAIRERLGLPRWPRPIAWLNPPFGRLAPWLEKCNREARRGIRLLSLTPATTEASWYWDHVLQPDPDDPLHRGTGPCTVYTLKGRLAFPGYLDKKGRPQVAGQGHMIIDWHGGAWGGVHSLDWRQREQQI